MGDAKRRGTYEERAAQAIERDGEKPEKQPEPLVIIPGPSISPLKLDKMLGMFGLTRWRKRRRGK